MGLSNVMISSTRGQIECRFCSVSLCILTNAKNRNPPSSDRFFSPFFGGFLCFATYLTKQFFAVYFKVRPLDQVFRQG